MPRRLDDFIYDSFSDSEIIEEPQRKRKIKKKNKKRKKLKLINDDPLLEEEEEEEPVDEDDDYVPAADDIVEYDTFLENDDAGSDETKAKLELTSPKATRKKKQLKTKDDNDGSSEEERWLHAIEAGTLEEVDDELKKIKQKDPKFMTARQRAMFGKKIEKDDISEQPVPRSSKEDVKIVSEKDADRVRKNLKRKQLADKKRENDKKKTMEKLLRKTGNKSGKFAPKLRPKRTIPLILCVKTANLSEINLPVGYEFPLKAKKSIPYPTAEKCGVPGCGNDKKYKCSVTGVPLCSLKCYKLNLSRNEETV